MEIKQKVVVLQRLYRIFDDTAAEQPTACRPGCDRCCTVNVTLTTLEAEAILGSGGLGAPTIRRLKAGLCRPRFIPRMTINEMADCCREHREFETESANPSWGPCPLLTDSHCPVYEVRPLACRSLASTEDCRCTGAAQMTDFKITLSTVFQQVIEHLDAGGGTGNLIDVLEALATAENRGRYRRGRLDDPIAGLLPNRPPPVLMVPPEHRQTISALLLRIRTAGVRI